MRRLGSSRKGGFRHENRIGLFTRQTTRHARHSALSATGVPNPSKKRLASSTARGSGARLLTTFFFEGIEQGPSRCETGLTRRHHLAGFFHRRARSGIRYFEFKRKRLIRRHTAQE